MSYEYMGAGPTLSPTSILKGANAIGARLLSPTAGIVKAMPLTVAQRNSILKTPADALINIFDPIEDAVVRVVKRVNAATKKQTRTIFGNKVDMRQVSEWPADVQRKIDPSTKNFLRRMLSINHFLALFWDEPLLLAAEMYKEGINIADGMIVTVMSNFGLNKTQAKSVLAILRTGRLLKPEHVIAAAKAGTAAWDAAEKAVNDVTKGAQDAAAAALKFIGLGVAPLIPVAAVASAPVAAPAAAPPAAAATTGVAAAGGVAIPPIVTEIVALVLSVLGAFSTAGGTALALYKAIAPPPAQAAAELGLPPSAAGIPGGSFSTGSGSSDKTVGLLLAAGAGVAAVAGAPLWIPAAAGVAAVLALRKKG